MSGGRWSLSYFDIESLVGCLLSVDFYNISKHLLRKWFVVRPVSVLGTEHKLRNGQHGPPYSD